MNILFNIMMIEVVNVTNETKCTHYQYIEVGDGRRENSFHKKRGSEDPLIISHCQTNQKLYFRPILAPYPLSISSSPEPMKETSPYAISTFQSDGRSETKTSLTRRNGLVGTTVRGYQAVRHLGRSRNRFLPGNIIK